MLKLFFIKQNIKPTKSTKCVTQQIILINYLKSTCQIIIDCNSLTVQIFSKHFFSSEFVSF